jgi:hypothetical protein
MLEFLLTSPSLYPLWRIGWIEHIFFRACRLLSETRSFVFLTLNFGFDISKYQGIVDFLKMLAFGAKFLILRCGYAITKDERFEEYIAAAYGVLPLATYHFYDPVYDPVQQAKKVIAILEPHRHKIRRVWLDFEFWWSGAYAHPKYWKIYRATIRAAGYKSGIYTRATWWDSRVGEYAAEFAEDPVWAAQYSTSLTLIPKGWQEARKAAMLWQRGTPAFGPEAGVSSKEIDQNLWNDEFDFDAEWGASPAPPPTQPGEPMETITHYLKIEPNVAGEYRTIRAENIPHIKGPGIARIEPRSWGKAYVGREYVYQLNVPDGSIPGGFAALRGDVWIEVFEANGQRVSGWIAKRHLGRDWLTISEVGAPDPEPEPEPPPALPTLRVTIDGGEHYESTVVEIKPKP